MTTTVLITLAAFIASTGATRLVLGWLRRRQILDLPNERSSHTLPTPRGGGLAVTPVLLLAWVAIAVAQPGLTAAWAWVAVAGALLLLVTSWTDDRHALPVGPRLLTHFGVVAGMSLALPLHALVFQGWLPLWADRAVTVLAWLWFLNLYNFMDGIDGITGIETAALGIGIAVVAVAGDAAGGLVPYGLAAAGAALGFLVWNWHPARIFLGDSGSVPLGFLMGGLLIELAVHGQLAAALILPAYYLADATITILWRLKDGEKVWQAHRRHFYQRAVRGGHGHAAVSLAILVANLLLIGCACLAAVGQVTAGALAATAVVAGLLGLLSRWAGGAAA